jgi:hypothetical protein
MEPTMAYNPIPSAKREVGKPIDKDLIDNIHNNLEDLNSRVSSISIAAGSAVLLNQMLEAPKDFHPIGTVIFSSLPLSDFNAEIADGGEWVLADGSSVTGSDWATLTGRTNLPDIRGRFIRAKDNGAGNNPSGDKALDSYTADTVGSHLHGAGTLAAVLNGDHDHLMFDGTNGSNQTLHTTRDPVNNIVASTFGTRGAADYYYNIAGVSPNSGGSQTAGVTSTDGAHTHTISGSTELGGSAETSPRYVTENAFIKINRGYIQTNTFQFVMRIPQQVTINSILVSPVSQGVSGNFQIDIKHGNTPTTATQSIFQPGQQPTLAYNASAGVTGLIDSMNNVVSVGQFVVVSVTATQGKLKKVHLYVSGDL